MLEDGTLLIRSDPSAEPLPTRVPSLQLCEHRHLKLIAPIEPLDHTLSFTARPVQRPGVIGCTGLDVDLVGHMRSATDLYPAINLDHVILVPAHDNQGVRLMPIAGTDRGLRRRPITDLAIATESSSAVHLQARDPEPTPAMLSAEVTIVEELLTLVAVEVLSSLLLVGLIALADHFGLTLRPTIALRKPGGLARPPACCTTLRALSEQTSENVTAPNYCSLCDNIGRVASPSKA
jgi:hypothetical protein